MMIVIVVQPVQYFNIIIAGTLERAIRARIAQSLEQQLFLFTNSILVKKLSCYLVPASLKFWQSLDEKRLHLLSL